MSKPKSSTLFHFTKNLESLLGILKNGFLPRYCVEDVTWLGMGDIRHMALPIVCFCDIPLGRIQDHVKFYGSYGLGLSKRWGEANALNPVHYISSTSRFASRFKKVWQAIVQGEGEKSNELFTDTVKILGFLKPVRGITLVDGKPVDKEFYLESEWRSLAEHENVDDALIGESYSDPKVLEKKNTDLAQHCVLRFTPSDVRYIFVRSDVDIPALINFISTEMDAYPSADLKMLMSRVTSLETIEDDF